MVHKERERVRRAEDYYSQYTFEPQINKVSQLLGRPSSTTELVRILHLPSSAHPRDHAFQAV
jgi:hypothetical protein